jgi:hypothetical protein
MLSSERPKPSLQLMGALLCFVLCGFPVASFAQDSAPSPTVTTETNSKITTPPPDTKVNVQLGLPTGGPDRSTENTSKQTNSSADRQSVLLAIQTTTPDNTTTALLISALVLLGILGLWGVSKLQQPE